MISEARRCIESPLDDPYLKKMEKKKDAPFGSEQLIRLDLELLLLSMIRRNLPNPVKPAEETWAPAGGGSAAYIQIMDYLKAHICGYVTIEDICRENLIGRSQLQKIFREQHNCGVIDFFTR